MVTFIDGCGCKKFSCFEGQLVVVAGGNLVGTGPAAGFGSSELVEAVEIVVLEQAGRVGVIETGVVA